MVWGARGRAVAKLLLSSFKGQQLQPPGGRLLHLAGGIGTRITELPSFSLARRHLHIDGGSGGRIGGSAMHEPPETMPYRLRGLNHIAIAVPDLMEAAERYRTLYGATTSEPAAQPEHGVTVVFVQLPGVTIELLHPLGEDSPIAKYMEKNPKGGIHHLSFTVDSISAALEHLKERNVAVLGGGEPKIGAHGTQTVFLHPKGQGGVLIELEEAGTTVGAQHDHF